MKPTGIEEHRKVWARIAKAHGWYKEPFYIQVWVRKDGTIQDSVSHTWMIRRDIVIPYEGDDDER